MSMRIGGLASGMDIDSIVAKLMQAERAPLDKFQQQKQTYEWQRDALRTINKNNKSLYDSSLNMTLQSHLIKKSVTSTNDAVSATASAGASGTLDIQSVQQLATSATIKSDGIFAEAPDLANTNPSAPKPKGVASNTKLSDEKLSHLDLFMPGQDTAEIKMKVLKDNGKMEDVSISISKDDTISSMIGKLNNSSTGLNAYYDERSGSLSISTKATGMGAVYKDSTGAISSDKTSITLDSSSVGEIDTSIYLESDPGNFFKNLGFNGVGDLTAQGNDASNPGSVVTAGQNAVIVYNGLEIERTSNTFDLNGYQVTLNKTYNETYDPSNPSASIAPPITLKAETDIDNFIDKVEEFVNNYNAFIKSTNDAINETKNRKYAPLTEEQKKEMSEEEIEKWEKTAKSGVIRRDQTVASGLQDLRSIIYSNGGNTGKKYDTLSEIGITTTKNYNDGGLLELDKDKLRAALLEDEEAVFKVFSNTKEGEPEGAIQKIRKSLQNFEDKIEVKAGKDSAAQNTFTIGRNLDNLDKRINTWEAKLKMIEDRYWSQFTAMEKAINKANEQSSLFFSGATQ